MYPKNDDLPTPIVSNHEALDSLDTLAQMGDTNETPHNVFIGHNLGHRVFSMCVPFRKFKEISAVANDPEKGVVTQRPLDETHAKKIAIYMLKGLVSAAMHRREAMGKPVHTTFKNILNRLGEQPYFSLQPIVCNIRNTAPGGMGENGIRGKRLETNTGETAAFKVYLSERHILYVIDGQHRRHAADLVMAFLESIRQSGKYPTKGSIVFPDKGKSVSEDEMIVWNEAYDAARAFATLTIEVHLGLNPDQERQLFHDLNRLGKKVDSSLAFQFDGSNPITLFIKNKLSGELQIHITESEPKDWAEDSGAMTLKDLVAINAIGFLNKGNVVGATPSIIEPRENAMLQLWSRIIEIPYFGNNGAKTKTVAAQPVMLKALAKIAFDLNFSNRRPNNGPDLYEQFLERLPSVDFSHTNPMWNFYMLTEAERVAKGLESLRDYLPEEVAGVNRDIGSIQGGYMRFGAKHNDIFPILSDMIRWATGLPSRRSE